MERLRVIYSKSKEAIYVSHLDIIKIFEQSLSRANINVHFTSGFNPKPELVFAHPLSVGIESIAEIVEITLEEKIQIPFFIKELNNVLPSGIIILSAEYVDLKGKNIMSRVYAATYIIETIYPKDKFLNMNKREIEDSKKKYKDLMDEYLYQDNILVLKKSKDRMERIDIKPQIIAYDFLIDGNLEITVSAGSKNNLKPSFIFDGYNEYIDEKFECNIKRTRVLYM